MKEKLERELNALPKNSIVLTVIPSSEYEDLNLHLVHLLLNKNDVNGTYITVNRSYKNLKELMKTKNIDHERLFFIDCVSEEEESAKNCVFIKSAESLTNISIALDPLYKSETHSFILLDSVDALSLYNEKEALLQFVHSLATKMREHSKQGIIGLSGDTDPKMLHQLSQFCDKVIDLTK